MVACAPSRGPRYCSEAIDLCYFIDSSNNACQSDTPHEPADNSICDNWQEITNLMYHLVFQTDIGEDAARVAVVFSATDTLVQWNLSRYSVKEELLSAIDNLQVVAGNTDTSGALDVIRDQVFGNDPRENAAKSIVIITDRIASDFAAVTNSIDKAHAAGILTVVVGIGNASDKDALKQLASDPKEINKTYFYVHHFNGYSTFEETSIDVQEAICYDLFEDASYTTTPAASSSPVPTICYERVIDLIFVLDSSESICRSDPTYKKTDEGCDNWKAMLDFAHELTNRLNIGPDSILVGFVTFATEAYLQIRLDGYEDRASLDQAIDQIKYIAGLTNTSGALDVMTQEALNPAYGARDYAEKVGVIMTDGKSTYEAAVQPAVNRAHGANIRTYGIGVTNQMKEDSVKQVSSEPKLKGEDYFLVADFDTMDTIINALQKQICYDDVKAM